MTTPPPYAPVSGFLREWSKHEHAPRTTCPTCHFESSEGYPPSHSADCVSASSAQEPAWVCFDCGWTAPSGSNGWHDCPDLASPQSAPSAHNPPSDTPTQ